MGIVYKARDPKINRIVAVKTISLAGQPAEDEQEYRERFYREAEAAGRVSHPGIVTIFDVGEETKSRTPYIVMEFVSGQSLDKLLSKGDRKLSVETALQLALELAEALDCAHRQGVVHRDLKPANILMAEDGHVKITDFGVAKLNLSNHTLAGRALGTPAFMSPEQLNGDAVDGRELPAAERAARAAAGSLPRRCVFACRPASVSSSRTWCMGPRASPRMTSATSWCGAPTAPRRSSSRTPWTMPPWA